MQAESGDAIEPAWSPARTELLRLHHALGLSAAVSALLIGGVSRNAVISKRRRCGLLGANPLQSAMRTVRCMGWWDDRPSRSTSPRRPISRFDDGAGVGREALPFMDWPAPADADPKTLANRSSGQCAWPLGPAEAMGDYRTLFCCAPVQQGRGYCAVHRARALSDQPSPSLRIPPTADATRGRRPRIVRKPR